jgi:hypothetical protein
VIGPDGRQYLTAAEIREQLGQDITAELLRDWKRRGLITGHPIGRANVYPLAEVVQAELATRDRTKPRRGEGTQDRPARLLTRDRSHPDRDRRGEPRLVVTQP